MANLLEVRDLGVSFRRWSGEQRSVVENLTFSVGSGEAIALVGPSGSGKTSVCRALLGLSPASAVIRGSILFKGSELVGLNQREFSRIRGRCIGMVFQDPHRSLNPIMRIGRQMREAMAPHVRSSRSRSRSKSCSLLRAMDLDDVERILHSYPHELSGGMCQRVLVAMSLAGDPQLLVADEATRHLDVITRNEVLRLLTKAQTDRGMAMILVSHDNLIAQYCSGRILMVGDHAAVSAER
jgi:ABC-type glutathione transport system ATPase component